MNNKINQINNDNIIKNIDNKNANNYRNEIICIYNKKGDEINLLHDFNLNIYGDKEKKLYLEGKNNINEKNIDIYINDKKIL